jgi:hypothetical protein
MVRATVGAGGSANPVKAPIPIVAPDSPDRFRVRVRMYRQGLGDCFLVTFPRVGGGWCNLLIDCGVLGRGDDTMTGIVEHIRDTIRHGRPGVKARLDAVIGTHEHRDHLSGFNQARDVFEQDFDFGGVWLPWTEDLTKVQVQKIKAAKRRAIKQLESAMASATARASAAAFDGIGELLSFSRDEVGKRTIAEALDYLKKKGRAAGDLRFLEPGMDPFDIPGVDGVRVYVLGPPRDPILLKGSEVTEKMKREGVIYHLTRAGDAGIDSLTAAVSKAKSSNDRFHPFAAEHRISKPGPDSTAQTGRYYQQIAPFVRKTYDDPPQAWRRIDDDWLAGFGQLALDLDSDTNNTSLVLAFEFQQTGEVLLFVGDAQVGNWQSWASVTFTVPKRTKPLPAHDLLARTVFYKVGHHCSHNATLRAGGLELMTREDLVAFIPLDIATAKNQGTKGWDMPAAPLFKALKEKARSRVVLSDVTEALTPEAVNAGVRATGTYVDYFLP